MFKARGKQDSHIHIRGKVGKAIPVTGREGP
jgi:hypothetical protein